MPIRILPSNRSEVMLMINATKRSKADELDGPPAELQLSSYFYLAETF